MNYKEENFRLYFYRYSKIPSCSILIGWKTSSSYKDLLAIQHMCIYSSKTIVEALVNQAIYYSIFKMNSSPKEMFKSQSVGHDYNISNGKFWISFKCVNTFAGMIRGIKIFFDLLEPHKISVPNIIEIAKKLGLNVTKENVHAAINDVISYLKKEITVYAVGKFQPESSKFDEKIENIFSKHFEEGEEFKSVKYYEDEKLESAETFEQFSTLKYSNPKMAFIAYMFLNSKRIFSHLDGKFLHVAGLKANQIEALEDPKKIKLYANTKLRNIKDLKTVMIAYAIALGIPPA